MTVSDFEKKTENKKKPGSKKNGIKAKTPKQTAAVRAVIASAKVAGIAAKAEAAKAAKLQKNRPSSAGGGSGGGGGGGSGGACPKLNLGQVLAQILSREPTSLFLLLLPRLQRLTTVTLSVRGS